MERSMLPRSLNRLIITAAICLAGTFADPRNVAAADKVRIGLSSNGLLFMPALAADAMGYFKEQGIDAEIVLLGGANKVYSAMLGGELEISVSSSVSILKGRSSGTDLLMIGSAMNQHGSNIVVSKEWAAKHALTDKSSYADRLKALKGITIGTSSVGGGSDQLVRLLAEDAGINPDRDMTLTVLAVGDTTLAAFARRRVDAITHSSPIAVKAIRDHNGMMMFHLTAGGVPAYDGFLYLAYSARQAWVDKNPQVAARAIRAFRKAHAMLHDATQGAVVKNAVHAKYHANIDAALYGDAWQDYVTAFPPKLDLDQGMIDRVVKLSEKLEGGDPIKPDAIKAAWTNRIVDAASAPR
jgi:NitT/TauT family transport system substrate-binding protein